MHGNPVVGNARGISRVSAILDTPANLDEDVFTEEVIAVHREAILDLGEKGV